MNATQKLTPPCSVNITEPETAVCLNCNFLTSNNKDILGSCRSDA
jgi:hypothetical protein